MEKDSYFYQPDKQETLRKTMKNLLGEYQGMIVPLNSILKHHEKTSIKMDPMLFEEKVLGTQSFSILRKLAKEHVNTPGYEELDKEIDIMEFQFKDLQIKTATWLVNPQAIEWKGDEFPPVFPSPSVSIRTAAKHKLAGFGRTLNKMPLHESKSDEEAPKKPKGKDRKKRKKSIP